MVDIGLGAHKLGPQTRLTAPHLTLLFGWNTLQGLPFEHLLSGVAGVAEVEVARILRTQHHLHASAQSLGAALGGITLPNTHHVGGIGSTAVVYLVPSHKSPAMTSHYLAGTSCEVVLQLMQVGHVLAMIQRLAALALLPAHGAHLVATQMDVARGEDVSQLRHNSLNNVVDTGVANAQHILPCTLAVVLQALLGERFKLAATARQLGH